MRKSINKMQQSTRKHSTNHDCIRHRIPPGAASRVGPSGNESRSRGARPKERNPILSNLVVPNKRPRVCADVDSKLIPAGRLPESPKPPARRQGLWTSRPTSGRVEYQGSDATQGMNNRRTKLRSTWYSPIIACALATIARPKTFTTRLDRTRLSPGSIPHPAASTSSAAHEANRPSALPTHNRGRIFVGFAPMSGPSWPLNDQNHQGRKKSVHQSDAHNDHQGNADITHKSR